MYSKWTENLTNQDEKVKFQAMVKSSVDVLDRLTSILNDEENALTRSELNVSSYDNPNWANKQAYQNGYRACLQVVKKLINLDQ